MKNNFKLLFFTILIFVVLLSLFNVCAADCDNSTMGLANSENDLVLIENLDSDDAAMENSNQDCDDYLQIESYQSDSKEVNDIGSDVNDKTLNSDILKVSDSDSPNSANGAANIYVNYNSGNDDNSGSNWKNSVKTIEKALQIVDDDGVIHIANGITYLSDSTSNDGISINKKVSIIGQSIDSIVSGNNNKRIFNIGLDGELFISNLTLTEGSASNGGAILILDNGETTYGKLAMSNSIISNCYASSRGGAIYSDKGSISNLNNVTFINGNSGSNGGAIAIQQRGSLSNVEDCKFINNSANNRGGAIYLGSNAACSIGSNNLFEDNNAFGNYGFGGAIHGANGVSIGTGNVFVSNYAEKGGSALSTMNNKQITGSYAFFINNNAGGDSSVIYAPNAGVTTTLDYCYWGTNNPAFSDYVVKGTFNHDNYLKLSVSADDSVISGNKLPITVDLSKNQNGQAVNLNSLPNMVPVLFTTTNGDFDVSSTKLVKGTAKTNYIAGKAGQTNITVDIYGIDSILNINVLPKAGTVFVNYTSGLDSNDGASWSSPVKTISRALAIVGDDSSIYVADGKNYLNNIDVNGLVISKNISIIGIGDNVVIDAKNRARIFNIDGLTVNLSNLIFANANVSNANDKRGSAIWAANSILNIDNCKFIDNTAGSSSSYGGAINLKSSKANIRGSYFDNNDAYYGGAINAEKNNILLNISNSTFTNNKAGATGGAICSYNDVVVDHSIFYNNTLTDKTKKGKSIKQYQDGSLTVKNSVILDGSASVNVANVSTASLENNWWGNNNSNKNVNPNPTYTNGNVNSYVIFETSINQDIVHVGDSVTIFNSLNHNQKGKVVKGLPELPIVISANLGTVSPDAATIDEEFSSTYNPTSSGNEVITANVCGIENALSFFVKQATPKVVIDDVSTQWSLGIYPGVANTFDVKLINSENSAISDLTIELVSNESNKILSSYSGTVKKGTSTISMIDSTIRQITENTVWPGAQSNLIKFDVNLKYDDEIISTFSADKILAYDGYFNKTYSYGGHDNTVNRKYTISGDIIMATQDVGVYKDQYSRFRNETWNIRTPENAEIVKVLLYFNYNWDTSFFPDGWTLKFNNHDILNEYVFHEMDRGNLGIWGAYNYGLLVFDVTDYYNVNANNSFIINKTGNCALYPSTLYVLYNSTDSATIKDVYFSDVCDVFYPLYNQKDYDDLLKFVVNFDNVDLTNLIGANWYVFSGSSSLNNNLTFNNAKAVNPFVGYSPNDCRPYVFDVTDCIGQNNEAWFISCPQSSTTVAYEQVLVVEKKVKTTIKFDFDDLTLEIGSKFTVKPTVNPSKANLTYKSNDTSVATISQKGMITAIKSGKALITATAGDGTVYPINSTSFILTVNKKQPTISSSASFDEDSQNYVINVVLPSDATGTVSVSVDGKTGSGKVSKGKAAISIFGLTSGSKEATVTYSGDDRYNSVSDICTFVAIKIDPSISVSVEDISVGDVAEFVVVLPSDATGTVSVSVDGKSASAKVSKGKVTVSVSGLTGGSKEATVSYSGDDRYNSVSDVCTFIVNKVDPAMSVSVDDISVGDVAKFSVVLPYDATGTVSVSVDGKSGSAKVSKGKATVSISGLTSGSKDAVVSYSGDEKYIQKSSTEVFKVNKIIKNMTVSVDNSSVETTIVQVSDLPSDASGIVTVTVEGKSNSSKVSNGKATIKIYNLTNGAQSIHVIYSNDDKYEVNPVTTGIDVNKLNVTLKIKADDINVGENASIVVSISPSGATGTITVFIDGVNSGSSTISKGKATIIVPGLTNGTKSVIVLYSGDERYNSNSASSEFTVNKISPSMSVSVDDISVGSVAKFSVVLPSDAAGTVSVSVDGKSASAKVSKGKATVSVSGLACGSKEAVVSYSGDDKYLSTSDTKTFVVSKVNPAMSVSVEDISVGDVVKFSVVLPSDATGTVTVSVDGKSASGKVSKGKATVSVSGLSSGSKKATVSYSGDDKYLSSSDSKSFVVNKVDPSMSVSVEDISVGDVAEFVVVLPSDATGTVNVSVDGKSASAKVSKGKATITISGLSSGSKKATVSYSGDEKYNSYSASSKFVVNKIVPSMSVSAANISAGDVAKFDVMLPSDATGTVIVSVDGKSGSAKVSKGKVSISISGLSSGSKDATVTYSGNGKYMNVSTSVSIEVEPIAPGVNVTLPSEVSAGDTPVVKVSLPADATGNVTIMLDGEEISTVQVINGSVEVPLSALSAGNHTVEVIYSGDDKYLPESSNSTVTAEKKTTHIKVVASFTRIATDYFAGERGANYKGYLLDQDNNPVANRVVKVAINGVTYKLKTDKKGAFYLQINLNTAKVYPMKVTFSGDSIYCAAPVAKTKLTVVKKSTSIKASNKVFKSKTKTKKITVTLKTVKNKYNGKTYLKKGKKITLRVNGKTYTAKTNAKGVAKFTIKLAKKGKYKAVIKFKGDKTYKASSKKIKIRIK